jgi:hypothetical protein
LSGEQIDQFFRAGLNLEKAARTPKPLRGRKMGLPHIAGMTIWYDPSDLTLLEIHVNGKPLEKERKYIVATTDLELSDIAGYLVVPDEEVEYEVPTIMPEVLEAYIKKNSPLPKPLGGRMQVREK